MSCRRYARELSGIAAGMEMSGALSAHLESCAECRAELARLEAALAGVDAELARVSAVDVPADLPARVTERLRDEPAKPSVAAWLRPAFALAAAALVLVAVGALMRMAMTPEAPAPAVAANPPAVTPRIDVPRESPPADATVVVARPAARRSGEQRPVLKRPSVQAQEPLVIVSAAQRDAVRRLMRQAAGRVEDADGRPGTTVDAPVAVAPVLVAPIVVDHIEMNASPASSGGGGARGAERHD